MVSCHEILVLSALTKSLVEFSHQLFCLMPVTSVHYRSLSFHLKEQGKRTKPSVIAVPRLVYRGVDGPLKNWFRILKLAMMQNSSHFHFELVLSSQFWPKWDIDLENASCNNMGKLQNILLNIQKYNTAPFGIDCALLETHKPFLHAWTYIV